MNTKLETPDCEAEDVNAMLPEYDFYGGVRGKYAARYKASSNVVVLDEDEDQAFPNTEAANNASSMSVQIDRHKNQLRK